MNSLKEGDLAPLFIAKDQNGKTVSLADYIGQKVLLYFYPKDNTPGCVAQACNLRDNYTLLKERDIVILGVSTDNVKSHKKFEKKFDLPFTLVADEDKKIVEDYGLWGEKKFIGKAYMGTTRTTFLIGEDGKIEKIIEKPDTKNHTNEVIDSLDACKKVR